uniref:Uncharacterized protein n=1 Tax=Solanum lycopersicum TaxID=4081 RepID=A0A3Q7GJY0_SOLLC
MADLGLVCGLLVKAILIYTSKLFLTADVLMLDKSDWLLWSQSKIRSPKLIKLAESGIFNLTAAVQGPANLKRLHRHTKILIRKSTPVKNVTLRTSRTSADY